MSEPSTTAVCHIRAPAKINLGLRVLRRRPDGYHDIETTFVAVDLCDELTFARTDSGGVILTWEPEDPGSPPGEFDTGESNLIIRAVRLVERERGFAANLRIHLLKRIPIAAGLGGGSSDAAATLLALSRLYSDSVPTPRIVDWASQLGSDIPFFLGPPCAFGTGRGTQLAPRLLFSDWWAVLVCPPVPLSAKEIYTALDLTLPAGNAFLPDRPDGDGFFAALARIGNALEPVVIRRVPEVSQWRTDLMTMGADAVHISGSGPTVFGVFREVPETPAVERLRATGVQVFVVRPLRTPMALAIA